jgi:glycine/D-amino acid oxidase-like deaminating enzyme
MRPRASSAEDSNATAKPRVVIAGAGIIGSSIAYHLAVNHGYSCTLVDKVGPGAAASGKAAGFLALDWCDGGPLADLARASFPMHERLARELSIESYRKITCEAVAVDETLVRDAAMSRDKLPKKASERAVGGRGRCRVTVDGRQYDRRAGPPETSRRGVFAARERSRRLGRSSWATRARLCTTTIQIRSKRLPTMPKRASGCAWTTK